MLELIISLACAACVGYISGTFMGVKGPWYLFLLLGVVGGLVGDVLFGLLGFSAYGLLARAIVAAVGSCVVIFLYRLIKK